MKQGLFRPSPASRRRGSQVTGSKMQAVTANRRSRMAQSIHLCGNRGNRGNSCKAVYGLPGLPGLPIEYLPSVFTSWPACAMVQSSFFTAGSFFSNSSAAFLGVSLSFRCAAPRNDEKGLGSARLREDALGDEAD